MHIRCSKLVLVVIILTFSSLSTIPIIDSLVIDPPFLASDQIIPADSGIAPSWEYNTQNQWVTSIISSDGSTVSLADDKILKLIDASSNDTLWSYNATEQIFSLSTNANGSYTVLGTVQGSGIISLHSKVDNESIWKYNATDWVIDVEISEDGSTIGAVDWSGWIYLFDVSSNDSLWKFKSPDSMLEIELSEDGSTIIAGGKNRTVYVFGRSSNQTLWTYKMNDWVYGVDVSSDGSRLVAACEDEISTFYRASNDTVWTYTGHDFYRSIKSPDGSTIACGTSSAVNRYNLYLFDFSSNNTLWKFNTTDQIRELDFTSDASHLIAGSYDMHMYIFSRRSNETILDYNMSDYVWSVSISHDGSRFVCGAGYKSVYYELINPAVNEISTSRNLYSASEQISFMSDVSRGTVSIYGAYLVYSNNNEPTKIVKMENLTALSGSSVSFSASIDSFLEGNVTYRVLVNDTFSLKSQSTEKVVYIDGTPPVSHSLSQDPTSPNSSQSVEVIANITDVMSSVEGVELNYSTDNGTSWTVLNMSFDTAGYYTATIPAQSNGTTVIYYVIAKDVVNNTLIINDSGNYFEYTVFDPSSTTTTTTTTETSSTTTTTTTTSESSLFDNPLFLTALLGIFAAAAIVVLIAVRHFILTRGVSSETYEPSSDPPVEEGQG